MRLLILLICFVLLVRPVQVEGFDADWSSLRKHDMPRWLDGTKFGIYCHWGPQTVQLKHADKAPSTIEAL